MTLPNISSIAQRIDRLLADGHHGSAERLLSTTVWDFARVPYALLPNTKYLAHYTSIDTLFSLLSCSADPQDIFPLSLPRSRNQLPRSDPRCLRLYDTYNSADPNEGHFFVHPTHRKHAFSETHSDLWTLFQRRTELPAYVTSFRRLSKPEDADNLIFWRTYGSEGQGCAIVFPVSFLDYPPLQVQYGSDAVIGNLDRLTALFDSLKGSPILRHHDLLSTTSEVLPLYVSSSLSPIPYLHKADDYDFEEEARVVVPFADLHPNILYCHRTSGNTVASRLRHFLTVPDLHIHNILRTGSRIVLGPAVLSRTNLSFVLKERLANQQLVDTKVIFSSIDYRP